MDILEFFPESLMIMTKTQSNQDGTIVYQNQAMEQFHKLAQNASWNEDSQQFELGNKVEETLKTDHSLIQKPKLNILSLLGKEPACFSSQPPSLWSKIQTC